MENERRVLKSAYGCCEGSVVRTEREQRGDLDSVHGEWEVKGEWQGCILGPDGREMEAVEVREGRRVESGGTGCVVLWARGREKRTEK